MFKFKLSTRTLVYLALLITSEIVLNRFMSASTSTSKLGLSFAPVVLASMSLGPIAGAIVGGVSDMLGAIAFPIGVYHPGFTIIAAVIGFVYGIFLYNPKSFYNNTSKLFTVKFYICLIIAVLLDSVLGLFINTYWISQLSTGASYWVLLVTRIPQYLIGIPLRLAVIPSLKPLAVMLGKSCHSK